MTSESEKMPRLHSLTDLLAHLGAEKDFLADRYDVQSLGVFGSYVRGNADPQSDLDVLVEFANPPSLFQFVRLQNELSDLLGVRVDLVMKSALKPTIGDRILAEVVPV
jgi:predicted nucleotidyltransferase